MVRLAQRFDDAGIDPDQVHRHWGAEADYVRSEVGVRASGSLHTMYMLREPGSSNEKKTFL